MIPCRSHFIEMETTHKETEPRDATISFISKYRTVKERAGTAMLFRAARSRQGGAWHETIHLL